MMQNIHSIYQRISDKLSFWQRLVTESSLEENNDNDFGIYESNKRLEHFQCDISTNTEICHLSKAHGNYEIAMALNSNYFILIYSY